MHKLVVILMGMPGAGKGTQGTLLAEKFNLYYFETSKIIEKAIKNARKGDFVKVGSQKYYFSHEKKLWEDGVICSPPFVFSLVKKKIKELFKKDENLLLSGSPRTIEESEALMPLLEKLYGKKNIKIVLLQISAEESIFRNSHRRICALMRHPILYTPETKNLKRCPLDGSKLQRRKGLDDPETIKVRLREYQQKTFPLIKYFQKEGFSIKKINGKGSVEQVFKRILAKFK